LQRCDQQPRAWSAPSQWSAPTRRRAGWIIAAASATLLVDGLFVAGSTGAANFLALDRADNWLHLVTAVLGLVIALAPVRG